MNRPPTPDVGDTQEKQPTLEEIINIKVCCFSFFLSLLLFFLAINY